MRLNTLKPAVGSKQEKVRVGRGIGSGLGKTCGKGHKGAKARSGYSCKSGFEGGQLPLQRRLPKFGFRSMHVKEVAEIQLRDLNKLKVNTINLTELKKANFVGCGIKRVKIILAGDITKAITIVGLGVTVGARKAIEKAGGTVE
jgi:large subunit ribosomal protein L15